MGDIGLVIAAVFGGLEVLLLFAVLGVLLTGGE